MEAPNDWQEFGQKAEKVAKLFLYQIGIIDNPPDCKIWGILNEYLDFIIKNRGRLELYCADKEEQSYHHRLPMARAIAYMEEYPQKFNAVCNELGYFKTFKDDNGRDRFCYDDKLHPVFVMYGAYCPDWVKCYRSFFPEDDPQQVTASEESTESQIALPPELNTDRAREVLGKAVKAGFLDDRYQPTAKIGTGARKAYLANTLAVGIGLYRKWIVFESLWSCKNLKKSYYGFIEANNWPSKVADIDKVF